MSDDISSPQEAAKAFKETIISLMSGLMPIIKKHNKSGWDFPNIGTLLKSATSADSSITKIFDSGLTPVQKFMFAQAWASSMDEIFVIKKFIKSSSAQWEDLNSSNQSKQETALLNIVEGLDIPNNGAQFLKDMYDKKDLLTDKEKKGIIEYIQACVYYAQMYQELLS